jgi:ferredoxin
MDAKRIGKESRMKFHVNGSCIGCGLCVSTCPEVFRMTEQGTAAASEDPTPEALAAAAQEAMENCPVSAIEAKA